MSNKVELQTVRIETIDQAINDWFDRTVDAHVETTGKDLKKVPVLFASGERAVTSRQKKGMRDNNGVLILPIISLRRTGINPDQSMGMFGTETPSLQTSRAISPKTSTIQDANNRRQIPQQVQKPVVYEVTSIPFPDRSIIPYELKVQTQYISQMNSVLEKIFHELDLQKSFVAPYENDGRHPKMMVPFEERKKIKGGYVVGYFQSELNDSGNFEEFTDQERIVQYTITFTVPATLQLDTEGERPAVTVERTAFDLKFGSETTIFVDDPSKLDEIFSRRK